MFFSKKINNISILGFVVLFSIFLIINPHICEKSVINTMTLCARVLIPSLFPFGVCMLYIVKSGIIEKLNILHHVTKLLRLTPFTFAIMLMSMLGGYPIGAHLINQAVLQGNLDQKNARRLLNFCINAGPGFIVSAVGVGLLKNQKIGYILLVAHISASLLICITSKGIESHHKKSVLNITPAENFVISASESANAMISICTFVILFGVITSYIEHYSQQLKFLKPLIFVCEITNAITKTNNIYLISFLFGFSGICIWCQIFSVGKNIKIEFLPFILHRTLHGILSSVITYILVKIFKITQPTYSNLQNITSNAFISTTTFGVSLLIFGLTFIISLSGKQKNIKILEEFV